MLLGRGGGMKTGQKRSSNQHLVLNFLTVSNFIMYHDFSHYLFYCNWYFFITLFNMYHDFFYYLLQSNWYCRWYR